MRLLHTYFPDMAGVHDEGKLRRVFAFAALGCLAVGGMVAIVSSLPPTQFCDYQVQLAVVAGASCLAMFGLFQARDIL